MDIRVIVFTGKEAILKLTFPEAEDMKTFDVDIVENQTLIFYSHRYKV